MKVNKREKRFDAVKLMRRIRDKISKETQGMSLDELRDYIQCKKFKKENEMLADKRMKE